MLPLLPNDHFSGSRRFISSLTMKSLSCAAILLLSATTAGAQTAAVTASSQEYVRAGGQITFTVTLNYPADAAVVSFSAKPPTSTWSYLSTGGAQVPEVAPHANDTTDPASPTSTFGWAYQTVPASPATFTFVLSYPAGLSGNQTLTFSASYRRDNVLNTIPVSSLVIMPKPEEPSITTPPASVTVTAGQTATFTVVAEGTPAPTIGWQRSTDGGATWTNLAADAVYSGVTTLTLTVNGATLGMSGHRFRATAGNGVGANATSASATLTVFQAPVISGQPAASTVVPGGSATFSVVATGSGPLTYQWYFTPSGSGTPQMLTDFAGKRSGTQAATLTLTNIQSADAGDYVCTITNPVNSVTSTVAQLSVVARLVRVVSQTAAPGASVVVPLQLVASGVENTVAFTLNWDPGKLSYTGSALGTDVPSSGTTFTRNTTLIASGQLAILIGLEPGMIFSAGTKSLATVMFAVNANSPDGQSATLQFGDSPAARRFVDAGGSTLPGAFLDGQVTVAAGWEGDVNGDGEVDAADWVALGRIIVGLNPTPSSGTTYMKADGAPRATKGDGAIDASDWVQLGRYVVGLDAPQSTGGPSGPAP